MDMVRVLVVDGNARVRERLAALVAEVPGVHSVLEADTGAKAAAQIANHCPEVIVVDLRIVSGNGLSLAARTKKNNPCTTVIVLTSEPTRGLHRACRELGIDHVFDKSQDFASLQTAIEDAARSPLR